MVQFHASELAAIPADLHPALFRRAEELARPALWNGTEWVADYRRLRVVARKG